MADDKRDGDDLFEDLDKFFAPIKDVEWDEPASAGARATSSEEHVSVRADETASMPPAEPPAAESSPGGPGSAETADNEEQERADVEGQELEDEDWYDTSVLETIEGIGVDDDLDTDLESGQVVEVGDVVDDEGDEIGASVEPGPGQAGLFAQNGEMDETESESGWEIVADDDGTEGEYAEATLVGEDDLGTETAPIATIDELMGDVESPAPGEGTDDLPAAARDEADGDEPHAVVGGSVGWDDGSGSDGRREWHDAR